MSFLAIGLVVKGGNEFIDKWISCAEKISDCWFIVDNGVDKEVRRKLINHPKVKQYHIQKDMGRGNSRDYQKILEMAREEDCKWIWNLDIDEIVPEINKESLYSHLLNTTDESVGFPLVEMRGDDRHYVMIKDCTPTLKHARLCHKCYKVLSHFEFDKKDTHGCAIPHNCKAGKMVEVFIQHFGHFTKELREEKRKEYNVEGIKNINEMGASWLEEDDNKVVIKEWEDWER